MNGRPDRIGRFSILDLLGRGAFSEVYLAEDRQLGVEVAVKILDRRHLSSPQVIRRFNDQARVMHELDGDGMVRVYELGEHHGLPFFVMEHCERGSLQGRQRQLGRRLTVPEASGLVHVLADVLGRLHQFDPPLVHRDIKPSNLLIRRRSPGNRDPIGELLAADEELVLGDFGLARSRPNETVDGRVLAFTQGYASPEQVNGEPPVDPRADLYSASAVVVAALSGEAPKQVFDRGDHAFAPAALEATGPLRAGLERALAHDRAERPADTRAWMESILGLTKIGRYPVVEQIGGGGFGDVYLVIDPQLDSRVALKRLRKEALLNQPPDFDAIQRFRDEARYTRKLEGDGIVRVYELGEHEGLPFFVMEYCERGSLEDRLNALGRSLTEAEGAGLVRALADMLGRVHGSDPPLIHRDIKPGNLLIRRVRPATPRGPVGDLLAADEELVLADFGLVKIVTPDAVRRTLIAGTRGYAAPEQDEGLPTIDARADIYSASAVVVSALSGERPNQVVAAGDRVFSDRALSAAGDLRAGLERGLAFDREDRPADVTAWADGVLAPLAPAPTVRSGRDGSSSTRHRWLWRRLPIAVGLGVGAVAVGLAATAGGPRIIGPTTGHVGDEVAFTIEGADAQRWIVSPPAAPDEVRADEVRADEVRADEVRADEVRADEVRADEVRADEVRADEVLVASWDVPTTVEITALTDDGTVSFSYTVTERPSDLRIIGPGLFTVGDEVSLSLEGAGGGTATWMVSSGGGEQDKSADAPLRLRADTPGPITVAVVSDGQRTERTFLIVES